MTSNTHSMAQGLGCTSLVAKGHCGGNNGHLHQGGRELRKASWLTDGWWAMLKKTKERKSRGTKKKEEAAWKRAMKKITD